MYLAFTVLVYSVLPEGYHGKHLVNIPVDSKELTDQDWQEAMQIEAGEYTPMTFGIVNAQFSDLDEEEFCNDNYLKCLVTQQSPPEPVCAHHRTSASWGKARFPSYCDLYLDNCRRGMRYWHLLGFGLCIHPGWGLSSQFDIVPSRRWLQYLLAGNNKDKELQQ